MDCEFVKAAKNKQKHVGWSLYVEEIPRSEEKRGNYEIIIILSHNGLPTNGSHKKAIYPSKVKDEPKKNK